MSHKLYFLNNDSQQDISMYVSKDDNEKVPLCLLIVIGTQECRCPKQKFKAF